MLHIELESERVERHLEGAYKRLVSRTRIPGFRNGNAPRPIFERYVGKDRLLDEALEPLVQEAVGEAIKSEALEPAATPKVSVTERDPIVKLDATVALSPHVTLGDYKSVRVRQQESPVTDAQVDEVLERVRESSATWTPVERDLRLGDLATITASGTAGGKQVLNVDNTEFLAASGSAYPVPGFAEAIVGMSAGESRKLSLAFPADYSREDLAGKSGEFNVTLGGVKEKSLPPIDDGLAKSVGEGLSTLAELRNKIRENLEAQTKDEARKSLERQTLDALVATSTFELPPMMVDHEADHIIYDQHQALAQYKVPLDRYIESIGKTTEQYVSEAKTTAGDRLMRSLVIEKLAETEAITVSDEAVATELAKLKARPDADPATDWAKVEESVRGVLRRRGALDKAIEFALMNPPADPLPAENAKLPEAAVAP